MDLLKEKHRFQPLVSLLCATVEAYRRASTTTPSHSASLEAKLKLLRAIADLLDEIQTQYFLVVRQTTTATLHNEPHPHAQPSDSTIALPLVGSIVEQQVVESKEMRRRNPHKDDAYQLDNSNRQDADNARTASSNLLEWIAVPVISVLKVFGEQQQQQEGEHDGSGFWGYSNTNTNNSNVSSNSTTSGGGGGGSNNTTTNAFGTPQHSAMWKCIERACRLWNHHHATTLAALDTTSRNTHQSQTVLLLLQQQYLQLTLVVWSHCLGVLPSGATLASTSRRLLMRRLDRGDDCLASLLATLEGSIRVVVVAMTAQATKLFVNDSIQSQQQQQHRMMMSIMTRMTRTLDTCIALVEPPPLFHDNSNTNFDTTNASSSLVAVQQRSEEPWSAAVQLQAVTTIQAMLDASFSSTRIPRTAISPTATTPTNSILPLDFWRQAFPGVYAGLYRRILAAGMRFTVRSQEIMVPCVVALTKLLILCFQEQPNEPQQQRQLDDEKTDNTTTDVVLKRLQALANPTSSSSLSSNGNLESDNKKDEKAGVYTQFLGVAQEKLPATLMVLVHKMTARSGGYTTTEIAPATLALLRAVLVETRHCWKEDLLLQCVESCLVLTQDKDATVAEPAVRLVRDYYNGHYHYSTKSSVAVDAFVAPRIIALMERLPVLAQQGASFHETELQSTLQLVTAYLVSFGADDSIDTSGSLQQLRTALSGEGVLASMKQGLISVLDVQFDIWEGDPFIHNNQSGTLVLAHSGTEKTETARSRFSGPRLRYMNEKSEELAYNMIRELGVTLGSKLVATLVDSCIADLYMACVARTQRHASLNDRSHTIWLHEWIGTIRLVKEMVIGAFNFQLATTRSTAKRKRIFLSLMQSILPILTTNPLWDLPTRATVSRTLITTVLSRGTKPLATDPIVVTALRGNIALICSLLCLLNSIIRLLQQDLDPFIQILLHPVLEKAGARNVGPIRKAAVSTLETMAVISRKANISQLIADNMESCLMGAMLGKIRLPGGRTPSLNSDLDENFMTVVDCAIAVFGYLRDDANSGDGDNSQRIAPRSMISCMEEVVQEMMVRFDYTSAKIAGNSYAAIHCLDLFHSAVLLLRTLRETPSTIRKRQLNDEPWYDLLDPFKKESPEYLNPKEGFEAFRSRRSNPTLTDENAVKNLSVLTRDVRFVSQVAWRSGYMLSQPSLMVQIESCNVLASCFAFLGWVASSVDAQSNESNGPATAVMRQVHASWSSLEARLKDACTAVTSSNGTSLAMMIITSYPTNKGPENLGEQRVYLTKLLILISSMTECSDDFMVSRFREIVWPCVEKVLRSLWIRPRQAALLESSSLDPFLQTNSSPKYSPRGESERTLLLSAMQCLGRVFRHRPVGTILGGLIPRIGDSLFPFLEDEDECIVSECKEAIQSMLRIDCDSLWLPLLSISGRTIPACPMKRFQRPTTKPSILSRSTKSVNAASDLLQFLDSLPEQELH